MTGTRTRVFIQPSPKSLTQRSSQFLTNMVWQAGRPGTCKKYKQNSHTSDSKYVTSHFVYVNWDRQERFVSTLLKIRFWSPIESGSLICWPYLKPKSCIYRSGRENFTLQIIANAGQRAWKWKLKYWLKTTKRSKMMHFQFLSLPLAPAPLILT